MYIYSIKVFRLLSKVSAGNVIIKCFTSACLNSFHRFPSKISAGMRWCFKYLHQHFLFTVFPPKSANECNRCFKRFTSPCWNLFHKTHLTLKSVQEVCRLESIYEIDGIFSDSSLFIFFLINLLLFHWCCVLLIDRPALIWICRCSTLLPDWI